MTSTVRNILRDIRPALAVLILAAGAMACTIDDPQVTDIGAVTIFPINPSIVSQSVTVGPPGSVTGNRMQTAIWTFTKADLTLDGRTFDLLFTAEDSAPDCRSIDSPALATISFGDCLEFLVLDALGQAAGAQATLDLEFWVQFKRVEPFEIPLIGDQDGDGVLNGNDNCPLVANADQRDTGGFGVGDDCRVVDFFSGVSLDSDGDGVADLEDNCVHIANPLQVNPPSADFPDIEALVSDGIGLACEATEQIINLGRPTDAVNPMPPISVAVDFGYSLSRSQGFVVIDFDDAIVGPDCEWSAGTCNNFDPSAIAACIRTSAFDAVSGCD